MATTPPAETTRNDNLDALQEAMDEFFEDDQGRERLTFAFRPVFDPSGRGGQ